jgi:SAM-dependent methyltransferase
MTLASAFLRTQDFTGTLSDFIETKPKVNVLEINEAGHLNPLLSQLPNHTLAESPAVDMTRLPYADDEFDAVLHSDTLEHVADPIKGLKEILRVLRPGGYVCYTIPVVVG